MVEQRSPKPRAEGSSPSAPAKENATTARVVAFFVFGDLGGNGAVFKKCSRRWREGLKTLGTWGLDYANSLRIYAMWEKTVS